MLTSRGVKDEFEAWAALAARMRVGRAQDRAAMLRQHGLEEHWESINEAWARCLNEDIAAGAMGRPHRYAELCAFEASTSLLRPSATLPGEALERAEPAIPFERFAPLRAPSRSSSPPAESFGTAAFAALRGSAAAAPSASFSRSAATLSEPQSERGAASSSGSDWSESAEGSLADFRASVTPSAAVVRPVSGQEHTQLGIDLDALRAAGRPRKL